MNLLDDRVGELAWRHAGRVTLALGVALQSWLWARPVWLYRDQVELYTLGMDFARGDGLAPFGKLMTGDYPVPGVLLQLLVGAPLKLWADARAPTLVLILFHALAAWLLWRVLDRRLGAEVAALLLAVFWLSPWRLYHSGFLWEASYLFLPAAVHLWACDAARARRRFWPSFALGATVVLTGQLHGSVVLLIFATLGLAGAGRIRLRGSGVALGCALGGVTLLPTLAAVLRGGLPASAGPEPLGLLGRLNSVEKALVYWFRFGSLDVGRRFRETLFCQAPGVEETPRPLACGLTGLTELLALASVAITVAAGWWLWRRARPGSRSEAGTIPDLAWYRAYCGWMLLATLAAAALSPVLIQGWHLLLAVPAACLPVALWIREQWPHARAWLRWAILLFLLWRLPAALLLGLGHPMYVTPPDPEMLHHVAPEHLRQLL